MPFDTTRRRPGQRQNRVGVVLIQNIAPWRGRTEPRFVPRRAPQRLVSGRPADQTPQSAETVFPHRARASCRTHRHDRSLCRADRRRVAGRRAGSSRHACGRDQIKSGAGWCDLPARRLRHGAVQHRLAGRRVAERNRVTAEIRKEQQLRAVPQNRHSDRNAVGPSRQHAPPGGCRPDAARSPRAAPGAGGDNDRARSGAVRARAPTSRGGDAAKLARGRRVGDAALRRRFAEFGELREFALAPLPDRFGQLRLEITEKQERSRCCPFLAHEQQRDLRRQQHDRDRHMHQRLGRDG